MGAIIDCAEVDLAIFCSIAFPDTEGLLAGADLIEDGGAGDGAGVCSIRPCCFGWNSDTGFESPISSGVESSVGSLDPPFFFLSVFRLNILLKALRIDTPVKTDRRGVGGVPDEGCMVGG